MPTAPPLIICNLDPEFQSYCHHGTQCNGISMPCRMSQSCCQQQKSHGLAQSESTPSRSQRNRQCHGFRYFMHHAPPQVGNNKSCSGVVGSSPSKPWLAGQRNIFKQHQGRALWVTKHLCSLIKPCVPWLRALPDKLQCSRPHTAAAVSSAYHHDCASGTAAGRASGQSSSKKVIGHRDVTCRLTLAASSRMAC